MNHLTISNPPPYTPINNLQAVIDAFCLLLIFAFGVVETWKELWLLYSEESSIKLKRVCPCGVRSFFQL